MYKHILVAVDGSSGAQQALNEAAGLAAPGTDLRVITVVENPFRSIMPAEYGELYDEERLRKVLLESAQALLTGIRKDLAERGITAEVRLVDLSRIQDSGIAQAILHEAELWPADLIVMGTHGRHGFKRMLLGSAAEQVVRLSTRPVLLVRETAMGDTRAAGDSLSDYSGRLFSNWPEAEYRQH